MMDETTTTSQFIELVLEVEVARLHKKYGRGVKNAYLYPTVDEVPREEMLALSG